VNYLGVLYGTKAFLPMMLEARRGHIVNVASLAGRFAIPAAGVYSASKHAVVAFSESLYYELRPKGILVTAVNPGLVSTEGFPHTDARERRLGRVMRPEDIAELIVDVVRRGRGPEVSKPRWLSSLQAVRVLTPALYHAGLRRAARGSRRATPAHEAGEDRAQSDAWSSAPRGRREER
jgi:short-subunit dehydrogenase